LAPPRRSLPRKVDAEAQAVGNQFGDRQAAGEHAGLEVRVGGVDQRVFHRL
jgi:hypothetical protein